MESGKQDGAHGNGDTDKDFSMTFGHGRSIVKHKIPV